jgi:hypothetical protein
VAIARGRWSAGALSLLLAVAIKPLGMVWLLLAGGMWPRQLGWRLGVGLLVLFAVPFLFGPPDYVWRQYADFGRTMALETDPARSFSDIRGFLAYGFGIHLSNATLLAMRIGAGLGTLLLARTLCHRWSRAGAALALYVLAAIYLVLFNPKTEAPTYTLLGPAIGVLFAWAVLERRSVLLSVFLAGVAYGLGFTYEIWGHDQYVWQPSLTLGLLAVVLASGLGGREARRACPWIPTPDPAPLPS